ncbi:hypothetical protein [Dermacoccus sp. BD5]|uniref:hypothetical protein n=1 Tax=Dermacoccus sp. BD5 TaxID=2953656 RepID=UPI00384092FB
MTKYAGLPVDVAEIFEYLADKVSGYGYLKWNEVAMLKADMMNVRHRWLSVDRAAFKQACRDAGMTPKEVAECVDYLDRTKAGRRLVPEATYRDFRFKPEPEAPHPKSVVSRDWLN